MKTISLTKGKVALVDDEDYERVNVFKWLYNNGYASRVVYHKRKGKKIKMSRFIMNVIDKNIIIDHKDRNPLNNQKNNLRRCTTPQNNINRGHKKNAKSTSKYRGVSYIKRDNIFLCCIYFNRKKHHIGHFKTELSGALAYDKKAIELFGEYANLNFPKKETGYLTL